MGDMEIVMAMLQGLFIFFFIAGLTCLLSKRLGEEMGRGRCSRYMESQDRLVIGQDKYLEIVRIERGFFFWEFPSQVFIC